MLTIHEAVNALNGDRHKKISEASAEIDKALGITSENHPAIGAWADNSMMVVSPGAPTAQIRAASAMKGYVADQKRYWSSIRLIRDRIFSPASMLRGKLSIYTSSC